jgi:predicted permease
MLNVLFQMAGLILCGIAWRWLRPGGLDPAQTRKVLTSLVYYLLLPALVVSVLWQAELGEVSLWIAASAAAGILTGLLSSFVTCRVCRIRPSETGAIVLAIAFPNATYLGLPVLEAIFGPWARSVAIQYDLFACTPLLFTVGVLVAAHFGEGGARGKELGGELLRIPAMWAALVAVLLNVFDVPRPEVLQGLLGLLNRGVVPLMLISLGLSLQWHASGWRLLPSLVPVVVFKLVLVPLVVLLFASVIGLGGDLRAAVVLEAAMPSMVLGLVLCDRFNLDVNLYAIAVTVTTALSLVSLPLWHGFLTA